MHQRLAASAASAFLSLAAAMPADAASSDAQLSKATLDYTVSATCTLTTPTGSSTVPCSSTLWNVVLEPGFTATVSATWDWHYVDDGLPVDRGGLLITGAGPSAGGTRPAFYESAGIYAQALPTCPRGACPTRPPNVGGDLGVVAVFESDNSLPDDITGSRTLTVTASWSDQEFGNWSGQVGFFPVATFVNAVPEPSTWALLGVSLAALAFVRRRHIERIDLRGVA